MIKLISIGAIFFLLAFPSVGFSSYLIQLKNGGQFATSHYWEESNQIMFYYSSGVAGISRDSVSQIRRTMPDSIVEPINKKEITDKKQELLVTPETMTKPTSKSSEAKTKDNQFIKEFALLKERSRGVQTMSNEELMRFANDLTTLRKKIVTSDSAQSLNDQLMEMYAMMDEIEALLKSRGQ